MWGVMVLWQSLRVLPADASWVYVCMHVGSWPPWWTLHFQEGFLVPVEGLVKAWCYCIACLEWFLLSHCFQFPLNSSCWTQAGRTQEHQHWQEPHSLQGKKKSLIQKLLNLSPLHEWALQKKWQGRACDMAGGTEGEPRGRAQRGECRAVKMSNLVEHDS